MGTGKSDQVIFSTVDAAVAAAVQAQRIFEDQGLEVRRNVIKAIRKASIANAERWGRLAVEETKMGRAEDKTRKNLLCATRTPGVEDLESRAYTGDKGLTLVEYAPLASWPPSRHRIILPRPSFPMSSLFWLRVIRSSSPPTRPQRRFAKM